MEILRRSVFKEPERNYFGEITASLGRLLHGSAPRDAGKRRYDMNAEFLGMPELPEVSHSFLGSRKSLIIIRIKLE